MVGRTHKNRILMLFFLLIMGYGIIIYNLFTIQIRQSSFFAAKGQQQYLIPLTLNPARALIYDRHKQPLALNKEGFSIFITPVQLKEPEKIKNFLKDYFPTIFQRLENNPPPSFMFVKRHITDQEKTLFEQLNLADLYFLKEPTRFYPLESASPVVGITGSDNEGLFGIELFYNNSLAGLPTSYTIEKDARSHFFYFKKKINHQGHEGNALTLTLDSTLQFIAAEEVKNTVEKFDSESGAALILNPCNGHILAMVNYPSFDPHQPLKNVESTKNTIIADTYEFGSVIKAFLALAALAEKVTDLDEIIDCHNTKTTFINGIRVNNPFAHGLLSFTDVIAVSNNIGTAHIALRLGPKLYEHYKKCGFGEKTGISLPGEQKGFVNPPHVWSKQSPVSLSFGYEIRATLLQLGCAFCMIANRGYPIKPVIILDPLQDTQPRERLYDQETIDKILNILEKTVTTGSAQKAAIAGYTIRAKTGTANLLNEEGIYDPHQNIFTCAALVEKDEYKRVIVVFIKKANKKNIFASTVTVPLAEHIIERMLIHENIIN
jgi:cell division protein FtsI/penicillin-binding protein 2